MRVLSFFGARFGERFYLTDLKIPLVRVTLRLL